MDINNVMDKEFEKTQKIEKSLESKNSIAEKLPDGRKAKRREQVGLLSAQVNELKEKLEKTKKIWKRSLVSGKRMSGKENTAATALKPRARNQSKKGARKMVASKVMQNLRSVER